MNEGPILVATDGSASADRAVAFAVELAKAFERPLAVVTVWQQLRGDLGVANVVMPDLAEVEYEWAEDTAKRAAALAESAGIAASTIVRQGKPGREICDTAEEVGAAFVVVGSHGWGALAGTLFGSALVHVVRHAPCPVLVTPEPHEERQAHDPAETVRAAS